MKIRVVTVSLAAVLLILAAASSGCESTPLLSSGTMTLLASPATAAPIPAVDPTGDTYYSMIIAQLLAGSGSTSTSAARATPEVGVSVTFVTSAGTLAKCTSSTSCAGPVPGPATVTTDSAGVAYVRLGVTDTDAATVNIEAVSGTVTGLVSVNNPLGEPNDEAEAVLSIIPDSPADASSGTVEVAFISESTDPDGDPITCLSWFISSTVEPSFSLISADASLRRNYDAEQRLAVVLQVTSDPDAETVCDTTTVFSPNIDTQDYLICDNTAPTAAIQKGPQDDQPTVTVATFSGSGSSDFESSIARYEWDCGNGEEETGEEIGCTYPRGSTARFFTVELVVTDRGNGETDCALESTVATETVTVPAL